MPTATRVLHGNKGRRPVNPREPQPERKAPRCPEHLDPEAKKEWRRLCNLLLEMNVLTEADGMALACLCQTWSTLGKAQRKLNETGLLFKTPSGYVQQSPFVSMVNVCGDSVAKLAQEFGLTPPARDRPNISLRDCRLDVRGPRLEYCAREEAA